MDPNQYGKIGTTARAEPVNNQEILFPNGYDRNQNLGRPLVTVCDTAGASVDDFSDEDFGFRSSSPAENVTVTIKFSSALDGIVTETDKWKSENGASSAVWNDHSKRKTKIVRECSVEDSIDTNSEITDFQDTISKKFETTSPFESAPIAHDHGNPDVIIIDETENNQRTENIQNNLYEEYERFVEPHYDIVRPKSVNKSILPSEKLRRKSATPKVKIVYETNSPSPTSSPIHIDLTDRNEIVSPIFKTPIVKETSSTSGDEAEDFLEYLKQLKGSNEDCIAENAHSINNSGEVQRQNQIVDVPEHNEKDKRVKSFKNELLPILSVNATIVSTTDEETPMEVIVISDDDEEVDKCDAKDKSLAEFDFGSLKRNKQASGGNGIVHEVPETSNDSDTKLEKVIPKRKKKKRKKLSKKITENGSDSDTDSEATDDDRNDEEGNEKRDDKNDEGNNDDSDHRNDDDGDDDDGDGNDGGNIDTESSENDNNDDNGSNNDRNNEDSDHCNDEPEQESDSSRSDGYENERYYSPGMRSRSTDIFKMGTSENVSNLLGDDECGNPNDRRNDSFGDIRLSDSMENERDRMCQSQGTEISCGYITLNQNDKDSASVTLSDINIDDPSIKESVIGDTYSEKGAIDDLIVSQNDFKVKNKTPTPPIDIGTPEPDDNSSDDSYLHETFLIDSSLDNLDNDCATALIGTTSDSKDNNEAQPSEVCEIETGNESNLDSINYFLTMSENGSGILDFDATSILTDKTSNIECNNKVRSSDVCEKNTHEENDVLDTDNVSSSCSDLLTAEDSEIIEILDYSETINGLDCKFKTIDTYSIDEYESFSDGQHSTNTTNVSCDDDIIGETVNDKSRRKVDCSIDRNNDADFSITNLDSKDIIKSLLFNPEVSEDGSVSSIFEIDECVPHTTEALSDNVPSLKENSYLETDQTVNWDISMFSDSSSSCSDDINESEFESALDEEFWNKTVGSASEMSFSDTFTSSSDESELEDDSKAIRDNKPETNVKGSSIADSSEDSKNDKKLESMQQDIESSHEHDLETDSEYESIEDIKSLTKDTSDFIRNIEKRISCSNCEVSEPREEIINKTTVVENDDVKTNKPRVKSKGGHLANALRENAVMALKNRPCRTISYFAPFLKDIPVKEVFPGKARALRLICRQRKALLERLLPVESSGVLSDQYNFNISNDSIESENSLHYAISDLKRKSKLCNDGDRTKQIGRPGEIIKLGIGYYIFGAGDKLDLPIGPKLKAGSYTDLDKDVCRPSIYFRGVPGIINNACKMSSFSFPKLAVPTDTSSRKILHACNRLATQLSPVEPRHDNKYVTMNSVMAVEDTDDTLSVSSADLTDMLMSSRDFLNSSRFDDAEAGFLKLYKEIQEKPEDNGRLLVETLTGLADICIRRSRMCRSNPLEWQWLCMHAIALLQYTVEFCDSELENQLDNEATEWYQEQRQASELKCRPLEDAFTRALYNCLKHDANFFDPFQSFSLPNTPVSHQRKPNLFPLSSTMPQYLLVPGMSYRVTDQGLKKQSSDDSDVAVDWLAKFQFYCKDRLQTKDAKCVTEKVLKSTKSTENDDTESLMSNGSHGSLDWDNSDLRGIEELEIDITEKESPLADYSLEYELASSETDNEGWDFFLHQRRNCDLQSVVQVVANDEEKSDMYERENPSLDKETQDIYQQEKSEKTRRKHHEPRDIVSPLHAHSISLTLARSFCRLADKLVQEEEYKKAEIVYEKILDIIDAIQDGTAGMLRFSARIMKNLGTVKSKQGKSSSGLVLLNKALNTYRDLQDEEANFEIAVALIELGNGYIVGKNHEDSVFDDVIIAICDFFEKDASDSSSTSTSSSVQSHISQMTSSLTSNTEDRNVEEAVMCYTEAIALLDCYEADEKQVDMFAKAIMRLGDCHFMQKDYDKALECYEKALRMFRTYNIFGKDSLMENAHVLCMLGVSSFMLHVYPRAASVFETALHMVRCAYGFKRTFLNGMLQSLSGITYYKMKNYHKCVSMCYQGYETYCELFGEGMPRLDKQKFWLVCQTLYVMGNSYNILSLQQKAMKYLSIARSLMKSSKSRERRQFMRVLQILGDCYFANYDYKTALQFYNEALEYGECESSISFDEVFDPNCASDEMTIHNHLVSKSAEAHLSMQQYQNAVHYLEQAHDMQEVMGEDIKGDLINTLHQLGHMHSVAGDVDKAIESYKECLEVFREIHKGQLEPEMCTTLGNLAAICYVKACIADTLEDEEKMTQDADAYFVEALALENNAEVCVKYGNFLYSQCHFENAMMQFWNALRNDNSTADIVYRGLEKVTLPELLQDEVDTHDEICLPSTCLARYLLILTHKALHELEEAEINLICLMEEVIDYDVPLLHSLLGYAMMELMLFEEAAVCFWTAAETEEDYQLACENYCICLLILLQKTIISGLENILDYVSKYNPQFCIDYSI